MFSRDNLIPELLSADAQRVASGPLGDNQDFLGPVIHQPLKVLGQVAFLDTHGGASVCAYFVVAVIGLSLSQSHYRLTRRGCGPSRLWLTVSPWSRSRPCKDTNTYTVTPCLFSWIGIHLGQCTYCCRALFPDTVSSVSTLHGKEKKDSTEMITFTLQIKMLSEVMQCETKLLQDKTEQSNQSPETSH